LARRSFSEGGKPGDDSWGILAFGDCLSIQISHNDFFKYSFAISRRNPPELCMNFSRPLEIRGRGECRMRAAPAVPCAKVEENAHEHTGSAEAIRHSLRNGFTAYFALSSVTRLV
jgi:hypothetical protein